ncbi:MAG: VWA domain-containing protein [Flavipsychrobacter sp.]|nr:VWA domain-containing protein [Flavipsychrobacter sp.]
MDWKHLSFAHPWYFGLLLLLPVLLWWQNRNKIKSTPSLRLTTIAGIKGVKPTWRVRFRPVLTVLRMITLTALIVALARPQTSNTSESLNTEGIDIVISMDISGSMRAQDFKPNRIGAAKDVALRFVDRRPGDMIGFVIFAGESFMQCPITIDHLVLKEQIASAKNDMLQDGTSIGMGLATAVQNLRNSKGKSRVIILMTDGVNNTGLIDPATALEIAKAYKIRVYTIGVGSMGQALSPVQTPMGEQLQMVPVQIDEPLMRKIATETGGKYFRATDNKSLEQVYDEIDRMEKTKVEVTSYKQYAELFLPFAALALLCLALELVLRYTVFKSIT